MHTSNPGHRRLAPSVKPIIGGLGLLWSTGIFAAETPMVEEILVYGNNLDTLNLHQTSHTATRLGLSALLTPGSTDLVSREQIVLKGDYSTLNAVTRTSGFAANASPGNGGSAVSTRGFAGHGAIVQLYDGTRLYVAAGSSTFPADTWTLDRIEVVRGPASVTHGVGALGATVNYIPKAPSFEEAASVEAEVSAGSFGQRRAAVGGGLRISDNWAYRIDLAHHQGDGYVDRADEQRQVAAGTLRYRPTENFDISLSVDYADVDASAYWGTPLIDGGIDKRTRTENYNVADALVSYQDLWPRLRLTWELSEGITFNSNSYYLKADRHWRNVESYNHNPDTGFIDRSFYLEILHDQQQAGNRSDLLFSGQVGGFENRFNIGAEINQIDFTHTNNRPYSGSSSVTVDNVEPGLWEDNVGSTTSRDFDTDTRQQAMFFDNILSLTERLSWVVGGRQDWFDYRRDDDSRSNAQGHFEPEEQFDGKLDGFTWRTGLVYQPVETLSLYGQTSTATEAIGSLITLSEAQTALKLTEGRQIELGVKHILWRGRAEYTLAAYHIEKENILSRNPSTQTTEQIGKQFSQGLEFNSTVQALDNLTIELNLAHLQAEFDEFITGDGEDLAGNVPRNIPRTTANLWINWLPTNAWRLGAGLRYVGERYTDDANNRELPQYTVADAALHWQMTENLRFTLRARNLTDNQDYVLAPYGGQWILGEPRAFELGLRFAL